MNTSDYKELFEQSSALVVVIDTDFTIVAASDSYLKVTKTIRENIVGRGIFDVFPDNPNDIAANGESKIRASFNRVLKNKTADTLAVIKYDIPKPESEGGGFALKYWKPCHSPVLDEFNNVKYIIQRVDDVTENEALAVQLEVEKKALKKIEDSEKRYNMLLMKSPFAFAVFKGKDMVITLANDSIKKIWGKGQDLEGKPLFAVLPELKDTPFPGLLDNVYTTGIPFYGDEVLAQFQRKDKLEDAYFNFIYQPYLEADETISGVTVIVYEVTANVLVKKALEEKREAEKKALKKIEDSNKRYHMMLMESPFAFSVMKGKDMVVTLANDLMKEFWGKGKDVEGKTLLQVLPELIDQPFPELINKVYATGIPVYVNEILAQLKHDGKLEDRYFNIVYQPHHEADETISGVTTIAYEVTEMVLARKKAEEGEYRYRMLIEEAAVATALFSGPEIRIQYANDAILTYWGKDKTVIGKPLIEVFPELRGQPFPSYFNAVYTTGISYTGVEEKTDLIINGKLQTFYFNFTYKALRDKEGNIYGIHDTVIDVTRQVLAKKALEESEMLFKGAVAAVQGILWTNNAKGEMEGEQLSWASLTGQRYEEYQGYGWAKAVHPDDAQLTIDAWSEAVRDRKSFIFEHRIRLKNGNWGHFSIKAIPLLNPDGLVGKWVGVHTDITEQRQAEESLKNAKEQLELIFNNILAAVYLFNNKGQLIFLNDKAAKIFGDYNAKQLLAQKDLAEVLKKADELFERFDEHGQPFDPQNSASAITMRTGKPAQSISKLINRHTKEISWQLMQSAPYTDEAGNLSKMLVTSTDITAQKTADEKIKESERRYHEIIYSSTSLIAIFKGENMIIDIANDAILDSWGKGKEIIGKSIFSVMPEIIEQGFDKLLLSVYKTGTPVHAYEKPTSLVRNGKLELLHYTFVYQPQRNANGEIEGVAILATEVTPQAVFNKQIKASEERYHNLIASSPIAIGVLHGEDLVITTVNDAIIEIWGKGKDVIGKPYFDLLPELVEQGYKEVYHDVYTTGKPFTAVETAVNILRHGKMERQYYNFILQAQRNANGEIDGVGIIASEVTSQALLNKKIKESEERFRLLVSQAPVAICVLRGEDYIIETINQGMVEMWGREMEEVLNKPAFDVLTELRDQGFKELLDNVYNTGERFVAQELPIALKRRGTLESAFVKFVYEPLRGANGMITGVMALAHEITDQVLVRKKIEESEKKFRVLTNAMPQKISTADAAGSVTFFNQQWLDDTGYTFEELKGWGWEKVMHPEDLERTRKSWQQSVLTGNIFDLECRIINTKGEYKWHLSRAVPVKDENGKITMWVGSNTEIHAQKEQKEELEKAVSSRTSQLLQKNAELENVNKDLTSFTYVSSHDLQEPLRKIQNFATVILLEEKNLSETGKGYFLRMRQTAQRMQELIEDLLKYSRAKSDERIFENVDLNLLLNEVKLDFEEVIHQKKAIIEATNLCNARIIPFQFRQLLQNLISNSLKFSRRNTPPHITLKNEIATGDELNNAWLQDRQEKLLPQKKYCHITFTDNGIGFDPQYKDRIFEVFQRLHSFDEYTGTGIGLAICKRIIENHNGIITATGKLKKGAQFDIYIPVD